MSHHFQIDGGEDDQGMGYEMIICCGIMVNFILIDNFKRDVLQWGGDVVPTKYPYCWVVNTNLSKHNMI